MSSSPLTSLCRDHTDIKGKTGWKLRTAKILQVLFDIVFPALPLLLFFCPSSLSLHTKAELTKLPLCPTRPTLPFMFKIAPFLHLHFLSFACWQGEKSRKRRTRSGEVTVPEANTAQANWGEREKKKAVGTFICFQEIRRNENYFSMQMKKVIF